MLLSLYTEANPGRPKFSHTPHHDQAQPQRILAALGRKGGQIPTVDDQTLSRYHRYLEANLSLPFAAHFPVPSNFREEIEFRGTVRELLDPQKYLGDEFDGIFCKLCKGRYELNLPLIDLYLPEDDPNYQWIEDYWYWFWNWH
jgi:hypothetical protein